MDRMVWSLLGAFILKVGLGCLLILLIGEIASRRVEAEVVDNR